MVDYIPLYGGYNKFEKKELTETIKTRTAELNFELTSSKFAYQQSIENTLEGNYTKALDIVAHLLPIFKKHRSIYEVHCYNTTGGMLADLGDIDEGLKNMTMAIDLVENFKSNTKEYNYCVINNHLVLGNIYYGSDQIEKAKLNFLKADSIASLDSTLIREKCYSLLNLTNIDLSEGNYLESFKKSSQVKQIATSTKYSEILAYSHLKISQGYLKLKKKDSALLHADFAKQISEKYGFYRTVASAHRLKSKIHKQFGDFANATYEYEKYFNAKRAFDSKNTNAMSNYYTDLANKDAQERNELRIQQVKQNEDARLSKITGIVLFIMSIGLIGLWFWFQRRKLREEVKKERMDSLLVNSQLTAIRSQMNPHFTFNCLNSIQSLVLKQDVNGAYDYISKFALLVRSVLNQSNTEWIDVEEEISTLKLYLELEELRFDNDFHYHIADNDLNGFEIPPLIIQPFVENAIKHGLLHKKGLKNLTITFKQDEEFLHCTIIDNGIGRAKSSEIQERQQLKHMSFSTQSTNTRFTLMQKRLGTDKLGVTIEDIKTEEGGTKVHLTIPCKILF